MMEKVYRILLSLIVILYPVSSWAQNHSVAQDTVAFRLYLSQGTLADYVHLPIVDSLYRSLRHEDIYHGTVKYVSPVFTEEHYADYAKSKRPDMSSQFIIDDDIDFHAAQVNTRGEVSQNLPVDLLLGQLNGMAYQYRVSHTDRSAAKRELVCTLEKFDSCSTHKPAFFADIKGRFKGNISKYVSNLYRRSILTNRNRMEKFTRHPSAEKLQRDPGVQFVIGLALYESWIRDVRKASETNGVPCPTDEKASR